SLRTADLAYCGQSIDRAVPIVINGLVKFDCAQGRLRALPYCRATGEMLPTSRGGLNALARDDCRRVVRGDGDSLPYAEIRLCASPSDVIFRRVAARSDL